MSDQEIFKFIPINDGASFEVSRGCQKSNDVIGALVIPASHDGKPVTRIANKGFFMCQNLTGVTIPESIETIGEQAFASCGALADITISNGVKKIEKTAFMYCHELKAIVIPDSVTNIDTSAFAKCENLADVTLPENVKLGEGVFLDCKFKKK